MYIFRRGLDSLVDSLVDSVLLVVKSVLEPQVRHQNEIQKVFLRRFSLSVDFWQKL